MLSEKEWKHVMNLAKSIKIHDTIYIDKFNLKPTGRNKHDDE